MQMNESHSSSSSSRSAGSSHLPYREKICRLCLEEHKRLAHLRDLCYERTFFVDIIRDCIGVDIDVNQTEMPQMICRRCLVRTLNFNIFKNVVSENAVFLRNINLEQLHNGLRAHPSTNDLVDLQRMVEQHFESSEAMHSVVNTPRTPRIATTPRTVTDRFPVQDVGPNVGPDEAYLEMPHDEHIFESASRLEIVPERLTETAEGPSGVVYSQQTCPMLPTPTVVSTDVDSDPPSSSTSSVASSYACSICSMYFSSRDGHPCRYCTRRKSRRSSTPRSNATSKSYACITCKKRFGKPGEWSDHMTQHYARQKFPCRECRAEFESNRELVAHAATHVFQVATD